MVRLWVLLGTAATAAHLASTPAAAQVQVMDSFNDSGMVWKRLSMNESDPFWYNTQTGESIWNDPREKAAFGAPSRVTMCVTEHADGFYDSSLVPASL